MKIKSVELVAQVHFNSDIPQDDLKHVCFIGRSNVGKSSLINALVQKKEMAYSSSTAGHTKTVNFYLVNKAFYLVDLPGYGHAQGSIEDRKKLQLLIQWYLTYPDLTDKQLIVLIIDANVGVTELDKQMLTLLMELEKNVIIVANKIDKLGKNDLRKQIDNIENHTHPYPVIPFSTYDKIGIADLAKEILDFVAT